jgi:predicted dehydrogenase
MGAFSGLSRYSVGLIGLGNIGLLYDYELSSNFIHTHSRAFSTHPAFRLSGVTDCSSQLLQKFATKYSGTLYESIDELLFEKYYDLLVVAASTNAHLTLIQKILSHRVPKVILCEKPFASYGDGNLIIKKCKELGVKLFVNYVRRVDPGILFVKKEIDSQKLKLPFHATIKYSKGMIHNGSHFVDLMNFFFGVPTGGEITKSHKKYSDYDGEFDFFIQYQNGVAKFRSVDGDNIDANSFTISFENKKLQYKNSGTISLESYSEGLELIESSSSKYQWFVAEAIMQALNNESTNLCTAEEAWFTTNYLKNLYERI